MCGRFSQSQSSETIATAFQLSTMPAIAPRYNIAPSQAISTIRVTLEQPERQHQLLRWGLIPAWSKDNKIGTRLINARAETIAQKPSFRAAFKQRRCLIIADGFYEWQRLETGKQPFYFQMGDRQPFAFAGLWERWQAPMGEAIESCTILTTAANQLLGAIHNRMPVILQPQDYDVWLDPTINQSEQLQSLLCPYPASAMISYPVSTQVNSPRNDSLDCIQPMETM
ncbi:MAG: SOS response-associated peptidase [Cyanothece sp. SIO1E1]|nr:SOS response-associated peptidase [Cyanothece sp. SIO1E1]